LIEIVNLQDIMPSAFLAAFNEKAVKAVLRDIVEGARAYWIQLAGRTFNTTKSEYINGIQAANWPDEDTAVISLTGVLPNLLEQGMKETDMHDTLLGPNATGKHTRAEGGFYRAIPFRHRTPGQGAHGTPMGAAYSSMLGAKASGQLGRDVYRAAKKLMPSTSDPYKGGTKWGGRLDTSTQVTRRGQTVAIQKLKDYHATNPYEGMVRLEKTYGGTTQSSYMTFRMISVDASGQAVGSPWIRPATIGKFLAHEVAEYVTTKLAPQAFDAYVRGLK